MSYTRRFPHEHRGLLWRAEGGCLTRQQLYRLHAIIARLAALERRRDPEYQRRYAAGVNAARGKRS